MRGRVSDSTKNRQLGNVKEGVMMKKKWEKIETESIFSFMQIDIKNYKIKRLQLIEKHERLIKEIKQKYDLKKMHKLSVKNADAVLKSEKVGCFYCARIFPPSDFEESDFIEWTTKDGVTYCDAWCPHCGIDSILPESEDYEITREMLMVMGDEYFGYDDLGWRFTCGKPQVIMLA